MAARRPWKRSGFLSLNVYRSYQHWLWNNGHRRMCLMGALTCILLLMFMLPSQKQIGRYDTLVPHKLPNRILITHSGSKYFTPGRDDDIFIYSAIANYQRPSSVILTTLDASSATLHCCLLINNTTLYSGHAQKYFFYHVIDVAFVATIVEYFQPHLYKARQYSCDMPESDGRLASYATLTSSGCSSDIRDYVSILRPPKVPGGLAVCAKIAHSNGLDPEKVIEWFELQILLGVDKVLMFDMGNQEGLKMVFTYYQALGFLDLQPYELPGKPQDRSLMEKHKDEDQFHNDESMTVLECRQRMSGYSFVLSHDVDEVVVPRSNIGLKQLLKEQMDQYPDSAGFYFYTKFFIYDWGPTHPKEDMMFTRYRKTTPPRYERTKFVFLPSRTLSVQTHMIHALSPYTTYKLPSNIAVLHHYRRCPSDQWSTCVPDTIFDHVMTRYRDLHSRVLKVRQITNTQPHWYSLTSLWNASDNLAELLE